jgi:hypothetical protein
MLYLETKQFFADFVPFFGFKTKFFTGPVNLAFASCRSTLKAKRQKIDPVKKMKVAMIRKWAMNLEE